MADTGTIYRLVDPRNREARYVGQTMQSLATRLRGHCNAGRTSPKVRAWVAELKAAGLKPLIEPVREGVPSGQLRDAEHEEITRLVAVGGHLLNEVSTAEGRQLDEKRRAALKLAAEQAAWSEIASAALKRLDGPVAPGDGIHAFRVPADAWDYMCASTGLREFARRPPDRSDDDRFRMWVRVDNADQRACIGLRKDGEAVFGEAIRVGPPGFGEAVRTHLDIAAGDSWDCRDQASRFIVLGVWYMIAVQPWRHLAELAGLPTDDESFIAWAGRDPEVSESLRFLASCHPKTLARLSGRWERDHWRDGPGHILGAIAASYAGIEPAETIRPVVARTLAKCAADHQLTEPMADMLVRLDPDALDSALGPDIAAEIDKETGLEPGTAVRVMQALLKSGRIKHQAGEEDVERIVERAGQKLNTTELPDYAGWYGPTVHAARATGACIVRSGLGHSKWEPDDEYLEKVRALWTPTYRN